MNYTEEVFQEEMKKQYMEDINKCWSSIVYSISQDSNLNAFENESNKNITNEEYLKNAEDNDVLQNMLKAYKIEDVNTTEFSGRAKVNENIIQINRNNNSKYCGLLIHEFAHMALYHYSGHKNYWHTLEFAIFNYCLLNRYEISKGFINLKKENDFLEYTKCFFHSYDIHNDPAYSLLSINVCKFDDLIRNIKFKNLQDLYNKACKYAERIRNKAIDI